MTQPSNESTTLTLDLLTAAVASSAAIRGLLKLQPAGGPGDKVFPPTYLGGQYHTEARHVDGVAVDCVVLDSVQSQANRMELALKGASERGEIEIPLLLTDFGSTLPQHGRITTLDAPHRIADAIFRDSELDGIAFRDSELGTRFESASQANATPLFELCPTALVFGVWDSTGPKGGLGSKFARALVSEIVGFGATVGHRTGSRIDPLPVSASVGVYEAGDPKSSGRWTADPDKAARDPQGAPLPHKGRDGKGKGKPSELNLGNVTPDLARNDRGEPLPGGVTISHALQLAVISLPGLRRLRFPVDGHESAERNTAARTVLAALALASIVYQRTDGFDLRSRCLLVPSEAPCFELIAVDGGQPTTFEFSATEAAQLLREAVEKAKGLGLPWAGEIVLSPSDRLVDLVRRSEEVLARTAPEEVGSEEA